MRLTRLLDQPIIGPHTHPAAGTNIQGPSLIAAPPWIDDPLGRYYLYFADHTGDHIKLATADELTGPWTLFEPGTLRVDDSGFLTEPPPATAKQIEEIRAAGEAAFGHSYGIEEVTRDARTPHVASPDVHLDLDRQQVVMYFHGLESLNSQVTRAAVSSDGLRFETGPEVLGPSYLRVFEYDSWFYGLAMPGQVIRSRQRLGGFETGPMLFEPAMRHAAVLVEDATLHVLWTRVGDAPESLRHSTVDLAVRWDDWVAVGDQVVLEPELEWEGTDLPIEPSRRGELQKRARQLRDPAFFREGEDVCVLYAGAGESGIGIATADLRLDRDAAHADEKGFDSRTVLDLSR